MNRWVIAIPFLMYLSSVGEHFSSPRTAVTVEANVDNIATGIVLLCPSEGAVSDIWTGLVYFSISLSLNILLTLMIVIRLILHGRNIRAATGSPAGVSGLYKTIATMLIESSAIFAVSSLLYIGLMAAENPVMDLVSPILAETQVCAFPRQRSPELDRLSDITTDCTGHCPTANHPTSRQQERINK